MSYPDYSQRSEDHQSVLILVRQIGARTKTRVFNRAYDKIARTQCVHIAEPQRFVWLRYRKQYPTDNNLWGDFQAHRKVLGLICVGKCESDADLAALQRSYDYQCEQYGSTLVDSRLLVLGMDKFGNVTKRRRSSTGSGSESHESTPTNSLTRPTKNKGSPVKGDLSVMAPIEIRCAGDAPMSIAGGSLDNLVVPESIRADSIGSDSSKTDPARSDSMRSDSTRSDSIRTDSSRANSIRTDSMRSDSSRSDSTLSDSMRSESPRIETTRSESTDSIRSARTESTRTESKLCHDDSGVSIDGSYSDDRKDDLPEVQLPQLDSEVPRLEKEVPRMNSEVPRLEREAPKVESFEAREKSTNVWFYPSSDDCVDLCDRMDEFATSLFWVIEGKRRDRYVHQGFLRFLFSFLPPHHLLFFLPFSPLFTPSSPVLVFLLL